MVDASKFPCSSYLLTHCDLRRIGDNFDTCLNIDGQTASLGVYVPTSYVYEYYHYFECTTDCATV